MTIPAFVSDGNEDPGWFARLEDDDHHLVHLCRKDKGPERLHEHLRAKRA